MSLRLDEGEAWEWWKTQSKERGKYLRYFLERGVSWSELDRHVTLMSKLRQEALSIFTRWPVAMRIPVADLTEPCEPPSFDDPWGGAQDNNPLIGSPMVALPRGFRR